MLYKSHLPIFSTVHFKRRLSSPTTLTQASQNPQSHCSSRKIRLKNSIQAPELIHFTDFRSSPDFCFDALKFLAKRGSLYEGKVAHAHIIKLGLYSFLSLQNQILNLYVKCKVFYDAQKLFDDMLVRNVVTWNTIIRGVVGFGSNQRPNLYLGFSYFRRMLSEKVRSDHITFNRLIRASLELNHIKVGKILHCFVLKLGFDFGSFVCTALVDLYAKFGLVEDARWIFDKVLSRDLVLWNVMVSCYAFNGLPEEAFGVFNQMQLEDVKGDVYTYSSLLSSCGNLGYFGFGRQVHGHIIKLSFDVDVQVASALVDMHAKNENIDDARKAFNAMAVKNVVSWTIMFVGYGRHGDGMEAMKLLQSMFQESLNPDELTLSSIISSCSNLSTSVEILQVHAYVVKNGFEDFLSVANSLINAYSKCGRITSAIQCFSSVANPDLVTWTSVLVAHAFHGLSRESIQIFEKMLSDGVKPDRIAFLGVLSACSHGGLVIEGLRYFNSMISDYHIVPDSEHYTCLVDLVGRAGLLHEAFSILTSMPVALRSDALGAFIGACKVHGNVQLAKLAANKLFISEPEKPVNYALMSNMYALEGHWLDVARVRKMMRDNCGYKFPGCSWIEIAGQIHTFASSDKSHPLVSDMYAVLGLLREEYDVLNVSANILDSDLD